MHVFDTIPSKLTLEDVIKELSIHQEDIEPVKELIKKTNILAKPKALYKVAYVENKKYDSLEIDGVVFTSRVLRVNLDTVERVFPYVVTAGRELDEIVIEKYDFLNRYYFDQIKEFVLRTAHNYLEEYLQQRYALGQLSKMNPGSLQDWSIKQQKELFSLFDNVEELIGVALTQSYLMNPIKSVSGIFFPTEIRFESCQLCQREKCIRRRAPYNSDLVDKYT